MSCGSSNFFGDGQAQPISKAIDATTRTIMTVDYAHHEIHQGSHFVVRDWFDVTGNGTTQDILLRTADSTKWVHLLFDWTTESEFSAEVFHTPTISADGTEYTPINNNLNSSKAATMEVYFAPTVTDPGTSLGWRDIQGSGGNRFTDRARSDAEFVLKQNTEYLLRITKRATGTDWAKVFFAWYEHTNKANIT